MTSRLPRLLSIAGAVLALFATVPTSAQQAAAPPSKAASPQQGASLRKAVFLTNWYAQAEHGGFYQAVATGLYRRHGLDVTIRMGGPQVNGMQLLAAGRSDFFMGFDIQTMKVREQGVQAVTVAAAFQKDPQVLIAHPEVKGPADFKGRTLLISADTHTTWWPWLRARWGLSDSQVRPYTFNIQPFLADRNVIQQGYLSSEPHAIEKAGVRANVFLLADFGYTPYATTVVAMARTIAERPAVVEAFVRASMEGWKSYLQDPAPANALIRRDNPNMTDELLAYGVRKIREAGLVTGGDAAQLGIGIVTDERMRATYDMLVANGLLDPRKVDLRSTYTTRFVRDLKVMP